MGRLYSCRGHIAVGIVQLIAQVLLFPVGVGQLVQRGLQRFRQDGQQHRVLRQVHHPPQYRIDLRLAGGQLRLGGIYGHHLQLGGLQLLHAFLILLLVLLVLFLLLFQFGPAVLQLLFSVLDLLADIRQFVGGIGQLLLGISQLFFGIGYFVSCFRYLFIQIVRHLLHPQFPTGFSHRLQRIFQCRG